MSFWSLKSPFLADSQGCGEHLKAGMVRGEIMKIRRFVSISLMIGVAFFLMAASASASTITYSTSGSLFSAGGLTLTGSNGATLTYAPNTSTVDAPTFISYGTFDLSCANCTATVGATFAPFSFNLTIAETGGGTGTFVGTSSGGTIFSNQSNVSVVWTTTQLGTGTAGATGGSNFGTTYFQVYNPTPIPAATSNGGIVSIQGYVGDSAVPEPATLSLIGGALLGLGVMLRRKKA
jgi:hypothetical protein